METYNNTEALRHILNHTSGLCSAIPLNLTIQKLASCEMCLKDFEYNCNNPEDTFLPSTEPGSECTYHYLSFGWLVAGCIVGAYALRHGRRASYEEVYDEIFAPILSSTLKQSGFKPCGGSGPHDIAFLDANVDISRMLQLRREAEAMGEVLEEAQNGNVSMKNTLQKNKEIYEGMKGSEFLLDPRIWNSEDALSANVPAAGGRFSAKGLALFYHELGTGKILSPDILSHATSLQASIIGRVAMMNNDTDDSSQSEFGLGYQIIRMPGKKSELAFGHSGIAGSIGIHHVESQVSIGIMFNKVGADKDCTKKLLDAISSHFDW